MKGSHCLSLGFLGLFVFCELFVIAHADNHDDEWNDLKDMINYDPNQRKPTENEYEDWGWIWKSLSITQLWSKPKMDEKCLLIFKLFLSKLLKDVENFGLPDEKTVMHYDVEVKLSKQLVSEFQKFLKEDNDWTPEAIDEALSKIQFNIKLCEKEHWKWRLLDSKVEILLGVFIVTALICTKMWSLMSWFIQIKRIFYISFFCSFIWNWFYLYMLEFAEDQKSIVQMESFNAKCTGLKEISWMDSISEWFRETLTLRGDPCKKYYTVLMVNPLLRVSPIRVFTFTLTSTFIDPLEHIGKGFSKLLRASLEDLPVTLHIPVIVIIAVAILVFIYSAIRYGLPLLWLDQHQHPPPALQQPQAPQLQ